MRALVFALQPNPRSWRALVQKHYRPESQKAGVYAAWVPSPEIQHAVCASLGIYRLMKAWIRSDGGIRDRCSEDALLRLCDNRKEELIFAVLSSDVKIASCGFECQRRAFRERICVGTILGMDKLNRSMAVLTKAIAKGRGDHCGRREYDEHEGRDGTDQPGSPGCDGTHIAVFDASPGGTHARSKRSLNHLHCAPTGGASVDICVSRAELGAGFPPNLTQRAGRTRSVRMVALTRPPMTTVASGF